MHLGLEAHAGHAQGLLDAFLVIDHIFLGQDVQHFLIGGNGHRLRRVQHPLEVGRLHLTITNRHNAVRVQAADVTAGYAHVHRVDLAARHQLRLFHGALDGLHG